MSSIWAAGCSDATSTANEVVPNTPAPTPEAGSPTDAGSDAPTETKKDASPDAEPPLPPNCGDTAGAPQRLLVTINGSGSSEIVAFNVADRKVDGRLAFADDFGRTFARSGDPYLLGQTTDLVTRLNPKRPWERVSSWNVKGTDEIDGGSANANPSAIIVPTCGGAGYVLRFNRNKIAIIDTAKIGEGNAPQGSIDLTSLLQPNDRDGVVEMTSAIYVPSKHLIYVLLGNTDLKKVAPDGFTMLCADTTSSIVAIDTSTGQLASLGGSAPGGGIALEGYNPPLGSPFWYDAAQDRLIVLSAGCNEALVNDAAGPIQKRRIEEVNLGTGQVKTLVSLDDKDFPAGMVFVDDTHAVVSFFGQAFFWNPTQSALGPAIAGGLDYAAYDGNGRLVGIRSTFVGGSTGSEIVSVPLLTDGGVDAPPVQKLLDNPFSKSGGFLNGAEIWPR